MDLFLSLQGACSGGGAPALVLVAAARRRMGEPGEKPYGGTRRAHDEGKMTLEFLIGAIIGSGLFIFAGRAPAEKLLAFVQQRLGRGR